MKGILIAVVAALAALPALPERTKVKPAFNIFSVAQDIELGLKLSKEMEAQKEIFRNTAVDAYVNTLGRRLAGKAPGGGQFRFQFKVFNEKSINAAGLPGGIVYVNRGTIEAASNEAELAGVLAHEIGHIVLRHGTHQISNAYVLQVPISRMGAVGSKSVAEVLSQIGGSFAASSIVLKNPMDAENEADLIGTQILYDSGYDPRAAAKFFEKLESGQSPVEHPNPTKRTTNVMKEVEKLGPISPNAIVDSREFQQMHGKLVS